MVKKFFCLFVVFLVALFCLMYFQKKELSSKEEPAKELLKQLTLEEKENISHILKSLFYNSAFGYTLFGDKPISIICDSGRTYQDEEMTFYQKHLFHLVRRFEKRLYPNKLKDRNFSDEEHLRFDCKKTTPLLEIGAVFSESEMGCSPKEKTDSLVCLGIDAPLFAIVIEDSSTDTCIYLVNKKAFLNTVQQNIAIFRSLLGNDITPESLLQSVINNGFEVALKKDHHALLGILFGFGVQNSLHFDRRDKLIPTWLTHGFPPWTGICEQGKIGGLDAKFFDYLRELSMKGLIKKTAPEKISPDPGFSTVQDELVDLNNKLVPVAGAKEPMDVLLSIPLPQFAGDHESEETKKLVEKYSAQRTVLMKILSEDNFIERVLEKFYSRDGD